MTPQNEQNLHAEKAHTFVMNIFPRVEGGEKSLRNESNEIFVK